MTTLETALQHADLGWPVFPCNGKIPLIKEWPQTATLDGEQLSAWWKQWPQANIGIVTGLRSGLLILDVDGPTGEQSLAKLQAHYGQLPETLTVKTGKGFHLYMRYPSDANIKNDVGRRLGAGLDVRGSGGFVIAPGSQHANGAAYEWLNANTPIASPPGWLIELLTQEPEENHAMAEPMPIKPPKATRYGAVALEQACKLVAGAMQGTRNQTLNGQAYGIGQLIGANAVAYVEAETRLLDAAASAGLTRREAQATIRSGMNAGMQEPRNLSHVSEETKPAPSPKVESSPKPKALNPPKPTIIQAISAADLMVKEFAAPRWAIPNLLPEGLTILAGRPKCGKSWLSFDLCLSVARGGMALGNQPAKQGKALYLALEDSQRRLQDRLLQLIQEGDAPNDLLFTTELPRYDQGGMLALENWLDAHPDCRLVVLDTLGRFRPTAKGGEGYAEETALLGCLQRLALDKGIALVVIHHTRKAKAENSGGDPLDDVLGSTGLTGVADSIWVLKRPRTEAVAQLFMTGRDTGESEQTIEFDSQSCTWQLQMEPETQARSIERQKILDYLGVMNAPTGPKDIASATGLPYDSVRHLIRHMEAEGSVSRKARGKYEAQNAQGHSQHSQSPGSAMATGL